jgi:hypothetical protein
VATGRAAHPVRDPGYVAHTRLVSVLLLRRCLPACRFSCQGYDDVVPGPVNAGDATVEIEEVPVIEAAQVRASHCRTLRTVPTLSRRTVTNKIRLLSSMFSSFI